MERKMVIVLKLIGDFMEEKKWQAGAELCQAQDKLSWVVLNWIKKKIGRRKEFGKKM